MESKIYMKETKKHPGTGLLPGYFKSVGIGIIALVILTLIILKVTGMHKTPAPREMSLNVFILGLLFIAWSEDKVEDEMTIALRLKSLGFAFVQGVLMIILEPFIDILFKNPVEMHSGQGLVIDILMVYLMIYYLQKKGR